MSLEGQVFVILYICVLRQTALCFLSLSFGLSIPCCFLYIEENHLKRIRRRPGWSLINEFFPVVSCIHRDKAMYMYLIPWLLIRTLFSQGC